MHKLLLSVMVAGLMANSAVAGEKKLMHCFAFTAVKDATQADWNAFYKATDELPKKVKGLTHVWYGKLTDPIEVSGAVREYGVCMEMADQAARRAYGSDPAHAEWDKAYSKVRVEGTTTFDIIGQ